MIYGETGTGKELFAQSIHAASDRAAFPFVDVNCAALPAQLLEGLLFGSVRGGFTDAQDRPGLFEQANGGTLLLDEVNSMPLALQGKLLRALQERRVRRLGAAKSIDLDVRVISTTNVSPAEAIERKELREDLYYRLSVANLTLPPLRKRQEDIPVYIKYFLGKYAQKLGLGVTSCSQELTDMFLRHPWPGNVRQLEHAIEGALNLVNPGETELRPSHLPMLFTASRQPAPRPPETAEAPGAPREGPGAAQFRLPGREEKRAAECQAIRDLLDKNGRNISQTARQMGISRQLLQYKIKKCNLAG